MSEKEKERTLSLFTDFKHDYSTTQGNALSRF